MHRMILISCFLLLSPNVNSAIRPITSEGAQELARASDCVRQFVHILNEYSLARYPAGHNCKATLDFSTGYGTGAGLQTHMTGRPLFVELVRLLGDEKICIEDLFEQNADGQWICKASAALIYTEPITLEVVGLELAAALVENDFHREQEESYPGVCIILVRELPYAESAFKKIINFPAYNINFTSPYHVDERTMKNFLEGYRDTNSLAPGMLKLLPS